MNLTYFDAKRELKKIYELGLKAIQHKNEKYINYLLLDLDKLENALKDKFSVDTFGLYVLKKDIDGVRFSIFTKLKKKKQEMLHEKKSRRNTS